MASLFFVLETSSQLLINIVSYGLRDVVREMLGQKWVFDLYIGNFIFLNEKHVSSAPQAEE